MVGMGVRATSKHAVKISSVYYFNKDWADQDGGELRLRLETGETVDVQPRFDRLVLFMSRAIEHQVLPAHRGPLI